MIDPAEFGALQADGYRARLGGAVGEVLVAADGAVALHQLLHALLQRPCQAHRHAHHPHRDTCQHPNALKVDSLHYSAEWMI